MDMPDDITPFADRIKALIQRLLPGAEVSVSDNEVEIDNYVWLRRGGMWRVERWSERNQQLYVDSDCMDLDDALVMAMSIAFERRAEMATSAQEMAKLWEE